jgi:outer membrane protein assembly factor BamB
MSFSFRPWVRYLAVGVLAVVVLGCTRQVGLGEDSEKTSGGSMPMFGGSPARNMVNLVDRGIPDDFAVKKGKEKHVLWVAALGNLAYGGPTIAGGRIFVGTNNERPRDKSVKGDRGVLMCFRQSDGKFLWQIVHDKLDDEANDNRLLGVLSTPCVDGDRLYYVSNRAELVCADVKGDEKTGKGKVLWTYDTIKELDIYPCQASNCSPLVVGDLVFVITGNGVNVQNRTLPKPKAADFIAVNKKTGKLAWSSNLPNGNIMDGQWSNPTAATVDGKTQVIFAGGDGWLYSLEAKSGDLLWKFDCNPKKATPYKGVGRGGEKCFIIATPVVHDKRCYVAVGQEPDDGPGIGHLWCIDITKKPKNKDRDLSPVGDNFDPKAAVNKDSGLVWHHGGKVPGKPKDDEREFVFTRTLSTVAVVDGLVYAAELAGYLQCLDAKTGKKLWEHDFQEQTWCSPYYVDGKVFLGTDGHALYVFKHGRTKPEPKKIDVGQPIKVPPIAAGGVLYVNSGSYLYAISAKK